MYLEMAMYISIYIAGIIGVSYLLGRYRPYSNLDGPDRMVIVIWPLVVMIGLLAGPPVLLIWGFLKASEWISNQGSKHHQAKQRRIQEREAAQEAVQGIDMYEDIEDVEGLS